MVKKYLKDLLATNVGKGATFAAVIGLILIIVGIVCASLDSEENDGMLFLGVTLGFTFGTFILVGAAIAFCCQDCCCCCMRPVPHVARVREHPQLQEVNGQPYWISLSQPDYHQQSSQHYRDSYQNANPAFSDDPPPYEAHDPEAHHEDFGGKSNISNFEDLSMNSKYLITTSSETLHQTAHINPCFSGTQPSAPPAVDDPQSYKK